MCHCPLLPFVCCCLFAFLCFAISLPTFCRKLDHSNVPSKTKMFSFTRNTKRNSRQAISSFSMRFCFCFCFDPDRMYLCFKNNNNQPQQVTTARALVPQQTSKQKALNIQQEQESNKQQMAMKDNKQYITAMKGQ